MFHCPLNEKSYLKILEPHDAPALFKIVDRNRKQLREWLPWLDYNLAEKDSKFFIESSLKGYAENKGFVAGIFYLGNLVGVISYHAINWPNKNVSIGYWIAEEAQGNGLVTLATAKVVDHSFNVLNLNRVEIRCATENVKSQRVPERLGFKLEGITRESEWLYDHFVDHKVYSMLRQEWKS